MYDGNDSPTGCDCAQGFVYHGQTVDKAFGRTCRGQKRRQLMMKDDILALQKQLPLKATRVKAELRYIPYGIKDVCYVGGYKRPSSVGRNVRLEHGMAPQGAFVYICMPVATIG